MRNVFRIDEDVVVQGKSFSVLGKNVAGMYIFTDIEVYKDGKIGCPGLRFVDSLEDLERAIERGDIVDTLPQESILPEGTPVYHVDLGRVLVSKWECEMGRDDYLDMVQDLLCELNGKPTSADRCREVFLQFLRDPTDDLYRQLKVAYQKVPSLMQYAILSDPENGDTTITAMLARDFAGIDREWLEEQRQEYGDLFSSFVWTEGENSIK